MEKCIDLKDKDYFLEAEDVFSSLGQDRFLIKAEKSKKDDTIYLRKYKKIKPLLSVLPFKTSDKVANIDRLPYYYAREKMQQDEQKQQKQNHNNIDLNHPKKDEEKVFFKFQNENQ